MCGNLTGQAAVTTHDDPLANFLGPRNPQLARQAYRAANRLSPEGRAALSGIALRRDDLSAAVAALRALPRGAGAAAVGAAMAPFRTTALDAAVFLAREPRDLRGRPFAAQLLCSSATGRGTSCGNSSVDRASTSAKTVSGGPRRPCRPRIRSRKRTSRGLGASAVASAE